ncbi:hypothetical protein CASFOL_021357 [Castilleja foliolosa]|uniref:Thioredoxin domain-containing protein n=1 Tax=Castilleja foliolosa TaxID=1961234 RepID=A0ABD3CWB7_9LAMI
MSAYFVFSNERRAALAGETKNVLEDHWCGPCRYIGQVISGFAEKYPKVVFLKVDIDEAPFEAAEYKHTLLPSFFFVRNGREIDNYLGVDMDLLQAKLAQNERIGMCVKVYV